MGPEALDEVRHVVCSHITKDCEGSGHTELEKSLALLQMSCQQASGRLSRMLRGEGGAAK